MYWRSGGKQKKEKKRKEKKRNNTTETYVLLIEKAKSAGQKPIKLLVFLSHFFFVLILKLSEIQ